MSVIDLVTYRNTQTLSEIVLPQITTPEMPVKPKKERKKIAGLYFYPRQKQWKASNVSIHAETLEAKSYGWWIFVKKIGPYLVFNDYNYSRSTIKHQSKVRSWLWKSGKSTLIIECPKGLQDLDSALGFYVQKIETLQKQINNPKSRLQKNAERRLEIAGLEAKIELVRTLIKAERSLRC